MLATAEEPFKVAVTVAAWSAGSAPVLTVKAVDLVFGATCAAEGTVNTVGALSESVTIVSFAVALDRLTVQVVLAFAARLLAVHCRLESVIGAVRERVTCWEELFNVAVTVAD